MEMVSDLIKLKNDLLNKGKIELAEVQQQAITEIRKRVGE